MHMESEMLTLDIYFPSLPPLLVINCWLGRGGYIKASWCNFTQGSRFLVSYGLGMDSTVSTYACMFSKGHVSNEVRWRWNILEGSHLEFHDKNRGLFLFNFSFGYEFWLTTKRQTTQGDCFMCVYICTREKTMNKYISCKGNAVKRIQK